MYFDIKDLMYKKPWDIWPFKILMASFLPVKHHIKRCYGCNFMRKLFIKIYIKLLRININELGIIIQVPTYLNESQLNS